MSSTGFVNGSTLTDADWFNDTDERTYCNLTSVSGTNTIVGTGPVSMTAYAAGQFFTFVPANSTTGAATLNITPSGSTALGAKNIFWNGVAIIGGEIKAGVPALVVYDGTQFNLISRSSFLPITNSLGADVSLNNTANYFDGPSIAQGTVGIWWVSGTITVTDNAGAAEIAAKLWDGTNLIAASGATVPSQFGIVSISLSGFITSPAGNIRISARDLTSTSGVITDNARNEKESTITAIRIG